jgi:hypothetical protein
VWFFPITQIQGSIPAYQEVTREYKVIHQEPQQFVIRQEPQMQVSVLDDHVRVSKRIADRLGWPRFKEEWFESLNSQNGRKASHTDASWASA